MRKFLIFIILMISLSSCFKIYESVSSLLSKDADCWIETKEMMFYYKGTKVMRGISISLHGDSSEISFRGKPGEAGIEKIDLSELTNVLQRQDISIYVNRDSVH